MCFSGFATNPEHGLDSQTFHEPGSGFPPNAGWSRTGLAPGDRVGFMARGGSHVNICLATRLILAVGYAWRVYMYLKQNLTQIQEM